MACVQQTCTLNVVSSKQGSAPRESVMRERSARRAQSRDTSHLASTNKEPCSGCTDHGDEDVVCFISGSS